MCLGGCARACVLITKDLFQKKGTKREGLVCDYSLRVGQWILHQATVL